MSTQTRVVKEFLDHACLNGWTTSLANNNNTPVDITILFVTLKAHNHWMKVLVDQKAFEMSGLQENRNKVLGRGVMTEERKGKKKGNLCKHQSLI